jgi:Protein of unknown function (DUF1580)
MIDIASEEVLSLAQAAKLLPPGRLGRPCAFPTILRWCLSGARSLDGRLVKLECLRLGGKWITSRQAIQRWAEALTPQMDDAPSQPTQTMKQRKRRAEKETRELEKLGI